MKNDTIIKTKDLSKIYGNNASNKVHALVDIDMTIKKGEFISIMGPSGCGKTTLMNMLGMLDRPSGGFVIIAGVDTTKVKERNLYSIRRENIGFIFQKFYLIPTLNALDNVLSPLLSVGITKEHREQAKALLEEVGLAKRMHHKTNEMSGGELQRVAVARALIMNPPIVLADEPTGNLDSVTGVEIIKLMKKMNKDHNTTFIIVTHDSRIAKATERTIFLKDGKTVDKSTVNMEVSF